MNLPVFSVLQCSVLLSGLRFQEKVLLQQLALETRQPDPDDADAATRTTWRLGVIDATSRALHVHMQHARDQEEAEVMQGDPR